MYILCPHCRSPIELVRLDPREEIACPSCGSGFHLETESTTGASLRDGQKVGRFVVLETLGQGAFGTVYKARDPELDRLVALKVPRAGSLSGQAELDRFLREARSVAQLRHPAIVAVHEVGQVEGVPYLVSDFVEGVTLTDLLSARRPPFREAAELIAAVADALDFAHRHGVVHRDVKPSNVMIGKDGRPVVMDFGLAKRDAGEVTMTLEGQVLGTPAYMAPEQAAGGSHSVDGRGDVYALGVILYVLLTGELPFRGTTRMLLHQVLHDEPRPPRRLNDRVPRELETVCLKCLRKEPHRRYPTAAELAADLRRWLRGEPVLARPVGRLERGWRWCRRNPAVAGLLAAVTLSLIGGTAVASYFALEQAAQRRRAEGAEQQARKKASDEEAARKRAEKAEAEEKARANDLTAKTEEQRRDLAIAQTFAADAAWAGNNAAEALDRLERVPADLRSFDWHYRRRAYQGGIFTCYGHAARLTAVAYSPDGTRLATASADGTARLWDARTGQELLALKGHTKAVWSVAFSPDGMRLATASADTTVRLWDARTGQELLALKGHWRAARSVAFSPDGRRLAAEYVDTSVRLWDARTGEELPDKPDFLVRNDQRSLDGKRLTLVQSDTIRVIDLSPLSAEEIALRRWATRRDPAWHAGEARRLQQEKQPAAAALHAALAAGAHPGAVADLRHAVALAASGHYADAARALLRSALWPPDAEGRGPAR
jgi:tRNA A-37 threonylcarbamoyl transferase component Bud32